MSTKHWDGAATNQDVPRRVAGVAMNERDPEVAVELATELLAEDIVVHGIEAGRRPRAVTS